MSKGEIGDFTFYDLGSGEVRWKVPPNKRIRASRERRRRLLMTGIDVKVSPYAKRNSFSPGLSDGEGLFNLYEAPHQIAWEKAY